MKAKAIIVSVLCVVLSFLFFTQTAFSQTMNIVGAEKVQVFIGFNRTPGASEQALVRRFGGQIRYSYNIAPAIAAYVPVQALQGLMNNPNVSYIEPVGACYALGEPVDTEVVPWGISRIGADLVHPDYQGDYIVDGVEKKIKVAVLDSGIDLDHPDLDVISGPDYVENDDDPEDDYGHGTHVAGTIAALDNEIGVIGVAPNVELIAVKVLNSQGYGDWADVAAALDWCYDNGVDIVNMSIGGGYGLTLEMACNNAYANGEGVLLVAAAGNSGNRPGIGDKVLYPAAFESVIAVAAVDSTDTRASFSSTGPAVELSAPGVNILSTYLDGGYIDGWRGTSMASPHVAGSAALLMSKYPDAPASWIRAKLCETADYLGDPYWYGYGLVDAYAACDIEVQEPPVDDKLVKVSDIKYTPVRRDLLITVTVTDTTGAAVSGASVSIIVTCGSTVYKGTSTTASNGTVTFKIKKAPSGTYTTEVTDVSGDGITWDGITPVNLYMN